MRKETQTKIYELLYQLGVTANYIGFFHTARAVLLCVEQPERLVLVTKWLYPEVAKQYGTNWKAVERNIRTVGSVIWKENPALLEHLASRPLTERPRTARLVAILAASIKGKGLQAASSQPGEERIESNKIAPADSGKDGVRINRFLVHLRT